MLSDMAEYCGTPQAKARSNSEHKVCLRKRAILRLLDRFGHFWACSRVQGEAADGGLQANGRCLAQVSATNGPTFFLLLYLTVESSQRLSSFEMSTDLAGNYHRS